MSGNWKVLVYMAADNSLYPNAEIDLQQICRASSDDIVVLLQLDGPRAQQVSRYVCRGGLKRLIWEAPDGYTDNRGKRLEDFLEWVGQTDSQETKYLLVLWGHGAGLDRVYLYKDPQDPPTPHAAPQLSVPDAKTTVYRLGSLDLGSLQEYLEHAQEILNGANANRYLKDIELGVVLKAFAAKIGRKIDVLGLDACLMGMAEICHELRESVSIMVASDETIPKGSWPYDLILGDLSRHPGMDPCTLSAIAVSRFQERYAMEQHESRIELSSLDLSACDEFAKSMKEFVVELSATIEDGSASGKVLRARDIAQNPDEPTYIDIQTFCLELTEAFEESSQVYKTSESIVRVLSRKPYVIYHRNSDEKEADRSCGLCLYFPEKTVPGMGELKKLEGRFALTLHSPLHKDFSAGDRKFPPNSRKFPPHSGKFPPHSGKNVMAIKGNEILWGHYVALQFNKDTGWAEFVKLFWRLVDQATSKASATPNART
jgi:hypothetical protein